MAPTLNLSSYYRPTSADILVRVAGGNDQTFKPHITADGHYMTFYSLGNNLVPNDTNNTLDLFRQDLQTGELLRVSSPALGAPTSAVTDYEVDMSPDGRYVLFSSNADGLVADDNNHVEDLFVRDMVTGSITLVSRKVRWRHRQQRQLERAFQPGRDSHRLHQPRKRPVAHHQRHQWRAGYLHPRSRRRAPSSGFPSRRRERKGPASATTGTPNTPLTENISCSPASRPASCRLPARPRS